MEYTPAKVTIDLAEYQELLELKKLYIEAEKEAKDDEWIGELAESVLDLAKRGIRVENSTNGIEFHSKNYIFKVISEFSESANKKLFQIYRRRK